jgi:hypothetical protein
MNGRGRGVEVLQQVGCTGAGARCCMNLYGTREERKAGAEWSAMLKRKESLVVVRMGMGI